MHQKFMYIVHLAPTSRKPMTILVINNHGGAIFSFLPIADKTQPSVLNQFFYTSHNVSLSNLCEAHSVKHLQVRTKSELQHALCICQQAQVDCVIEIESSIENNATFHSILRSSACQAADCAFRIVSGFPNHLSIDLSTCKIRRMEYSLYRVQLCAPPTSIPVDSDFDTFYRDGFIVTLSLEDGSVGFGEVAPIRIHNENLVDVEEQLKFLVHIIQGSEISFLLTLLRGSFSSWIWRSLGIPPSSIFPSVRCGLEMAILNALAARQGSNLSDALLGYGSSPLEKKLAKELEIKKRSRVQICALVDSNGTPKEVAHVVAQLAEEGFTTIKLKVARRADPMEDVAVVQEIRQKVGYEIKLRVDANRNWSYEEAIQFGSCVKCYDLQYIEEPVHLEDDIIRFCKESGLPAALDETIDNIQGEPFNKLAEFVHPGIVAVVIKPCVVGGFENAALIAKWAQQHEKMAVISGAFESTLSLSMYILFAYYLQQQNTEMCRMKNKELNPTIAHGLGTYRWLNEDVSTERLKICVHPDGDTVEASVEDAALLLQNFQINHATIQRSYKEERVQSYQMAVDHQDFSCSFKVLDAEISINKKVIIFLHGFLGTGEDWVPIMKALSGSARCISIDLPGHGKSQIQRHADKEEKQEFSICIEIIADVLHKLIRDITTGRVILVGYSMGARIALYMALNFNEMIDGAVIISGSPGLRDLVVRNARAAQDDARARYLTAYGLHYFLDTWYAGELWKSLRDHPHFERIISSRAQHDDVHSLAKSLSDLSIGRQPSLWEDLEQYKKPLLIVVGENDQKFKGIAEQMCSGMNPEGSRDEDETTIRKMVMVPNCGHAVHLENPLYVINAVSKFLKMLDE